MKRQNLNKFETEIGNNNCIQKRSLVNVSNYVPNGGVFCKEKNIFAIKNIAKYLLIFVAMLVFSNAKISGKIAPFAVGFAFALVGLNFNPLIIGPVFAASQIIVFPAISTLVIVLSCFSAMMLAKGISLAIKKDIPIYIMPTFQLLGLVGYIYFNIANSIINIQTVAYIIISILFCYISNIYLSAAKKRGVIGSLSLDEKICGALCVLALSIGLSGLYISNFSIAMALNCFLILFLSKVLNSKYSITFAALAGLGLAFANGSLLPLAIFCVWSVAVVAAGGNKYFSSLCILVVDFLVGAYFGAYAIYSYVNLINIAVPCIIFCSIPNKVYQKISQKILLNKNANGILLTNINCEDLQKKLIKTSKLMQNMGENYQKIAYSQTQLNNPEKQIAQDIKCRVCKNCENRNICVREKNMENEIAYLAKNGIEKGKVSLLDLRPSMAQFCCRTTSILSATNQSVTDYVGAEKLIRAEDANRVAIGNQFLATGELLSKMANQICLSQKTDANLAEILHEELLLADVVAKDIQVQSGEKTQLTLIVKSSENDEKIAKIVSKTMKYEFESTPAISAFSGYKMLKLRPKPKYDLSIGVAAQKKNGSKASGDNYSVVDLGNGKVLITICDGMGSGNLAEDISERVLELVENFYLAGFESDVVIKNIAQLISTSEKEMFSTLDICVFDKETGNTDFLKSSAPPSVFKSKDVATLIKGESLPIGITCAAADKSMKILQRGDIVVLATDGVVDSFATDEEYAACINNSKTINMSLFSENILQEANERILQQSGVSDDMTVVALRVI